MYFFVFLMYCIITFYIEISNTKDRPGEKQWSQFVQKVPGVFPAPCFPSRNLNKEIEDRTDTKPHWLTDLPYMLCISVNCFQLWLIIIFPTKITILMIECEVCSHCTVWGGFWEIIILNINGIFPSQYSVHCWVLCHP